MPQHDRDAARAACGFGGPSSRVGAEHGGEFADFNRHSPDHGAQAL